MNEGQWAFATTLPPWSPRRRVLVCWNGRVWHGVEGGNAWAPSQLSDIVTVERPHDPFAASDDVVPLRQTSRAIPAVEQGNPIYTEEQQ